MTEATRQWMLIWHDDWSHEEEIGPPGEQPARDRIAALKARLEARTGHAHEVHVIDDSAAVWVRPTLDEEAREAPGSGNPS